MKNLWCVLTLAAIPCLAAPANAEVISRNAADLLGSESVEVNYNPAVNASDEELVVAQGAKTKAIPYGNTPRGPNYVSISGNLAFLKVKSSLIDIDIDSDTTFQPTIAIGKKIQDTRLELELSRITVKVYDISDTATGILVNGYYDFSAKSKVSPYVGGGVGLVFDEDYSGFGWQIKGGAAYKVSREGDVYGEVKYINVIIDEGGLDSVNGFALGVGYRHHF